MQNSTFDIKEVSEIVGRSHATIRWHIRRGHITPARIKCGSGQPHLSFNIEDVEKLVKYLKER